MDSNAALPVTVVVPAKNEQRSLPSCLSSLNAFSRVVVVDSSSEDDTPAIAQEFGATYLNFEWNGRFPKKRNWVLQSHQFGTPWVLFLDADEQVTDEFVAELRARLQHDEVNGYWLNYRNYFQGRPMKHGIPFRKLALFRIGSGNYERIDEDAWTDFDMEIHEHPIIDGPVSEISAPIIHRNDEGLHEFIAKHNVYSTWEARRFVALEGRGARDVLYFTPRQSRKYRYISRGWFCTVYFLIQYFAKLGFLDRREGFQYAVLKAIYFFDIYCKIKEIRQSAG